MFKILFAIAITWLALQLFWVLLLVFLMALRLLLPWIILAVLLYWMCCAMDKT